MIKLMEKGNIFTTMVLNMLAIGRMISSTGTVRKHGRMELIMKDNMRKGKNMEKENLYLQMGQCMRDSSIIMTFMVMECTFGLITENIKENGKETKCMEKELQLGQMVEVTRESMSVIYY